MKHQSLKERVLKWLVRREHSRHELMARLLSLGVDRQEAISLLDEFAQKGWQSDERFAQVFVSSHTPQYSKKYLIYRLAQHNIDKTIIASLEFGDEKDRAILVWRKKFGRLPRSLAEKNQQVRFLLSRGFSLTLAMRIVEDKDAKAE